MKRRGFTLVELLAVIVILAIILSIAIPSIASIINNATKGAFESDAKMVLKQLEYIKLDDDSFDPLTVNIETLSDFNLSSDNYEDLGISTVNNENYVIIIGKNKWDNFKACGTIKNMIVVEANNNTACNVSFDYIGAGQIFNTPVTGKYKIELWGAQGYGAVGGKGSYTSGTISLNKNSNLYFYVGQSGRVVNTPDLLSFNGGGGGSNTCPTSGKISWQGGGATDVRLLTGIWNEPDSLKSRIMIAAGGGANGWGATQVGGNGGGLEGYDGIYLDNAGSNGLKATQTFGGNRIGTFGTGGTSALDSSCNCSEGSGGGGGYYGGGGSRLVGFRYGGGGGGGSSFISGHTGCDAINVSGVHTGQPNHYSGKVFTDTVMIDGSGYGWTNVKGSQIQMPKPFGSLYSLGSGNVGNGYARIIYIGQ